jgi:oligopeptide transport system permease protein
MSMTGFVVRRVLWTIPLLLLVMLATFALLRGAGGSPFNPPEGFSPVPKPYENELRDFYRLDEPWPVEFATYVRHVFTFDFGPSQVQRNLDVTAVIDTSFPITLELVLLAAAIALPVGIGLGLLAAANRNTPTDLVATGAASVALVLPVFFFSYVFSHYFVFEWHVVEPGWDGWQTKVLPTIALALAPAGYSARLIRAAAVESLDEDYVRTARAKGLRRRRVLWVHVLRNSLAPFLSAAMPMLALLITGAFFVETMFRIPGASSFFVAAADSRDYPLLMGLTVALAAVVLLANLVSDVLLALVDPRIREGVRR